MARRKNNPSDFEKAVDKYLPFLLEIRKRLLFIVAIFLLFVLLGFIYYQKLISVLLAIFQLEGVNIVFTSPFQFLSLAINTAILTGTIVIFPLIVFQILAFLKPALSPKEFRMIIYLIPLSTVLFLSGFAFGILIMRYVIVLFYERTTELNIGNFLDVSRLLSQILTTSALLGIAFQFPIVLTVLMRLRIVSYKFISTKRLYAYAISLVFAALLPPTDLLSLVLLTLPLIVLYELTMLANKLLVKQAPAT